MTEVNFNGYVPSLMEGYSVFNGDLSDVTMSAIRERPAIFVESTGIIGIYNLLCQVIENRLEHNATNITIKLNNMEGLNVRSSIAINDNGDEAVMGFGKPNTLPKTLAALSSPYYIDFYDEKKGVSFEYWLDETIFEEVFEYDFKLVCKRLKQERYKNVTITVIDKRFYKRDKKKVFKY